MGQEEAAAGAELVEEEELLVRPHDAVVALLRLLDAVLVLLQELRLGEGDGVDALERVLGHVAAPEGAGCAGDGDGAEEARVQDVRAAAEVHHRPDAVDGDARVRRERGDELHLELVLEEHGERLVAGHLDALELLLRLPGAGGARGAKGVSRRQPGKAALAGRDEPEGQLSLGRRALTAFSMLVSTTLQSSSVSVLSPCGRECVRVFVVVSPAERWARLSARGAASSSLPPSPEPPPAHQEAVVVEALLERRADRQVAAEGELEHLPEDMRAAVPERLRREERRGAAGNVGGRLRAYKPAEAFLPCERKEVEGAGEQRRLAQRLM